MISYIILFSYIALIYAYEPSCTNCKYFIPHFSKNPDLGLCKMFNTPSITSDDKVVHHFAVYCRNNENFCGKNGLLYEPTNEENIQNEILDEFDHLNNMCCGEVNESYELEQLEKDFFELFQKIKRHNKKRIYKTTRDLYKLFKKK